MEKIPNPGENSEKMSKAEYIALAWELERREEGFPFPGINPDSYQKIKAVEADYPGIGMPIDEQIRKFQAQGMKVVLGKDPESGNVFILPLNCYNTEEDGILPRHLEISPGMDESLKKLIAGNKK